MRESSQNTRNRCCWFNITQTSLVSSSNSSKCMGAAASTWGQHQGQQGAAGAAGCSSSRGSSKCMGQQVQQGQQETAAARGTGHGAQHCSTAASGITAAAGFKVQTDSAAAVIGLKCAFDMSLTISLHISPYLTISHHISPYLSISHHNYISHHISPYLTISHHISPYLTISHHNYISHHISPYLTISHRATQADHTVFSVEETTGYVVTGEQAERIKSHLGGHSR